MMVIQLVIGTSITAASVVLHIAVLVLLVSRLRALRPKLEHVAVGVRLFVVSTSAVFTIVLMHTLNAWVWALIYRWLNEFDSLQDALYFSVATVTTVGYGDVVLSPEWQLLGTFEAMSGMILFGVSTAFLFTLLTYLLPEQSLEDHLDSDESHAPK